MVPVYEGKDHSSWFHAVLAEANDSTAAHVLCFVES